MDIEKFTIGKKREYKYSIDDNVLTLDSKIHYLYDGELLLKKTYYDYKKEKFIKTCESIYKYHNNLKIEEIDLINGKIESKSLTEYLKKNIDIEDKNIQQIKQVNVFRRKEEPLPNMKRKSPIDVLLGIQDLQLRHIRGKIKDSIKDSVELQLDDNIIYKYGSNGLLISTVKKTRNKWFPNTPDQNEFIIYEWLYEYNQNNQEKVITYNIDGKFNKRWIYSYDSYGNSKNMKVSDYLNKEWINNYENKYNSNGLLIERITNNKSWERYIYDDKNRVIESEFDYGNKWIYKY